MPLPPQIERLEAQLNEWLLREDSDELSNTIYRTILTNALHESIWDERVLSMLEHMIAQAPLNADHPHQDDIAEIRKRTRLVRDANDLIYEIARPRVDMDRWLDQLSSYFDFDDTATELMAADRSIQDIRVSQDRMSHRVGKVLEIVQAHDGVCHRDNLHVLQNCLRALQDRERGGVANSLLTNQSGAGVVLSLTIRLLNGSTAARVHAGAKADRVFTDAVERARLALVSSGFLEEDQSIAFEMARPDTEYVGSSVAMAAYAAILSSAREHIIDPFTAFTGNISINGDIRPVNGIAAKIQAAVTAGMKRLVIPEGNVDDVAENAGDYLEITAVRHAKQIAEALTAAPVIPSQDTLQHRKTRLVEAVARQRGWSTSVSAVQDGLQMKVSPPRGPALTLNFYETGTHSPRQSDSMYRDLLDRLNAMDSRKSEAIALQHVLQIPHVNLQLAIKSRLESLDSGVISEEQYCLYVFRFSEGGENLVVKQFRKGKLLIQGKVGRRCRQIIEAIVTTFRVHNPGSSLGMQDLLSSDQGEKRSQIESRQQHDSSSCEKNSQPYVGTDESGKGDYFGPLVVAAFWLDSEGEEWLATLGVKDSKLIRENHLRQLAKQIREKCRGQFEVVTIMPPKYNDLYEQFRREGQTLNDLLAWGHSRALEEVLTRNESSYAVADQFGNPSYIESRLMQRGRTVDLIQIPKGEQYMAVAAASILARDAFVRRLEGLGCQFDVTLPKGASEKVVTVAKRLVRKHGDSILSQVAKTHFRTTHRVLGGDP